MDIITSGSTPPDNTTLDVSTSGQLEIKNLGVGTAQIAANAVTAAKVANNTLTASQMASGTLVWEQIQEVLLGSNSNISFASIPTGYKRLWLLGELITTVDGRQLQMRINSDSGSTYAMELLSAQGTTVAGYTGTNTFFQITGLTSSSIPCGIDIKITNISTRQKSINTNCGTSGRKETNSGHWSNNSNEITQIDLLVDSGVIATGSRVVLLGAK